MSIINIIGFIPQCCDYTVDVMDFLNKKLLETLKGMEPFSVEWSRKAKWFHSELESRRVSRRISRKKMSVKKTKEILCSMGVSV